MERRNAPGRVLHVTLVRSDGGVPQYLAELVRHQVHDGWAVRAVVPEGSHAQRKLSAIAGVDVTAVPPSFRPLQLARTALGIRRAVADARPDLVHVHSSHAGVVARGVLATLRPRPVVVFQPHAWSFLGLTGRSRRAAVAAERVLVRFADHVVCGSADELAEGERHHLVRRATVIDNAVDLERFTPAEAAERAARKASLGVPATAPVAVCVARIAAQKQHVVLLEAWRLVAAELPDAVLVLVGSGPLMAELQALGTANVIWTGPRNDPEWFHAMADVGVLSSSYETMALSVLESMASGAPVVCTAAHGATAAVGETGDVVPLGDSAALAAALIARLRARDAEPSRQAARRRAEEHFGLERWAREFSSLYERLIR